MGEYERGLGDEYDAGSGEQDAEKVGDGEFFFEKDLGQNGGHDETRVRERDDVRRVDEQYGTVDCGYGDAACVILR